MPTLGRKVRIFVDWVAELFARSDLIQRRCSLPCAVPDGTQPGCAMHAPGREALQVETA